MGLFDKAGDIFNKVTGQSAAAETNARYQKEFAQNQVQWRAKDLEAAGFNKILAAGGEGATGGVNPGMTGGGTDLINAAIGSGIDLFKAVNEQKNIESQSELNSAQTGLVQSQKTEQDIKNNYMDKSTRKDIEEKEARIAQLNTDTRYNQKTFDARVEQQMAQTIQEVAEGKISEDNAKFLETYGISKQQALQLGQEGLRLIGNLITAGAGAFSAGKLADKILKNKKYATTSARKASRNYRK